MFKITYFYACIGVAPEALPEAVYEVGFFFGRGIGFQLNKQLGKFRVVVGRDYVVVDARIAMADVGRTPYNLIKVSQLIFNPLANAIGFLQVAAGSSRYVD